MTRKTAILLHGTGGDDKNYFWFSDTKDFLQGHGFKVWWPLLPNTDKPELSESLAYLTKNMPKLTDKTIIIGHSSACPLILSLLQKLNLKISQVILVSGFYQSIDDEGISAQMLEEYDWGKIRKSCAEFIFINSDNDPWGCDDSQARKAALRIRATQLVAFGQGHMGSISFNQPYSEFELLKRLIKV